MSRRINASAHALGDRPTIHQWTAAGGRAQTRYAGQGGDALVGVMRAVLASFAEALKSPWGWPAGGPPRLPRLDGGTRIARSLGD